MKRFMLLLAVLIASTLSAQVIEVAPATPTAQRVRAFVAAAGNSDLYNVYAPAGFTLLWTRNSRPTPQAVAAIAQLQNAETRGLAAADYQVETTTDAVRFDVALTTAILRYASDVSSGRIRPRDVRFDLDAKTIYLPALVAQLTTASNVASVLAQAEPQNADYKNLIDALATYRRIAAESANESPLPVVAKLAPGDTYEALSRLAAQLRRLGDLSAEAHVGTTYEGAVVEAVKHFQQRHGLDGDGVVSTKTFAQLNVPASRRVAQLELALERARWTPMPTATRSIVVNIPEFTLRARDESGELTMRVVVGSASRHETPVFDGGMRHVVFRPYWSVPPNIQRSEIVRKLENDRGWLARNGYEVTDNAGNVLGDVAQTGVTDDTLQKLRTLNLKVRQKPGASNSLGLVKFLFPNDNNVYLHDTPSQSHFARARRDYSHGCIRLAEPEALAAWALRWTPEKARAAMNGKQEDLYVKLDETIPVLILYTTAAARENGDVYFFEDIYGHDAPLTAALGKSIEREKVLLAQASANVMTAAR